jgi:hypothetical protein
MHGGTHDTLLLCYDTTVYVSVCHLSVCACVCRCVRVRVSVQYGMTITKGCETFMLEDEDFADLPLSGATYGMCMCVCMHVCMSVRICMHACVCVCVCECVSLSHVLALCT